MMIMIIIIIININNNNNYNNKLIKKLFSPFFSLDLVLLGELFPNFSFRDFFVPVHKTKHFQYYIYCSQVQCI